MSVTLMPMPWWMPLDDLGNPVPGGLAYFYAAGTAIDLEVYTDSAGLVPHAQPVVLDGFGRATVYLSPSAYKVVFRTPLGVLIREQDYVSAVPFTNVDVDVVAIAGEGLLASDLVYLADGTNGTAGRWFATNATTAAKSTVPTMIGMVLTILATGESGTVRIQGRMTTGLSGLTSGANYYVSTATGGLTTSPGLHKRFVGQADTTNSLVLRPAEAPVITNASRSIYNAGTTPGTGIAAGVTAFLGARGRSATETSAEDQCPVAGTLKNLFVRTDGASGAGETFVVTVRKNAADTILTCTITNAALTASDIVNTVAVVAGDRIAVKVVASAGASTREIAAGFEISY